jgi:hypothetical protein
LNLHCNQPVCLLGCPAKNSAGALLKALETSKSEILFLRSFAQGFWQTIHQFGPSEKSGKKTRKKPTMADPLATL